MPCSPAGNLQARMWIPIVAGTNLPRAAARQSCCGAVRLLPGALHRVTALCLISSPTPFTTPCRAHCPSKRLAVGFEEGPRRLDAPRSAPAYVVRSPCCPIRRGRARASWPSTAMMRALPANRSGLRWPTPETTNSDVGPRWFGPRRQCGPSLEVVDIELFRKKPVGSR